MFMQVTTYNKPITVGLLLRKSEEPAILIKSGDGQFCVSSAEAIQLRDDLSRAITEAATAAAKAVEVVA
jgi:hypothetical protein